MSKLLDKAIEYADKKIKQEKEVDKILNVQSRENEKDFREGLIAGYLDGIDAGMNVAIEAIENSKWED